MGCKPISCYQNVVNILSINSFSFLFQRDWNCSTSDPITEETYDIKL